MADKSVLDLPVGNAPTGTEELHAVQGANSRKFTFAAILAWMVTSRIATAAEYMSNAAGKLLSPNNVWEAADEAVLTYAANTAVDMGAFLNAQITLIGNGTLENPTGAKVGQSGHIRVIQDGTGNRTLSYGSNYVFAGGTAPTLSTTASDEDLLFYKVLTTSRIFLSPALDIS